MNTKIEYFKENTQGIDYVIGDIHGQWWLVHELLKKVNFCCTKDRLFCCGDMVDRGKESELFMFYLEQPWFFSVMGNHESMMICSALSPLDNHYHLANGGMWFQYEDKISKESMIQLAKDLPILIEVTVKGKKIGIIHADCSNNSWDYTKENIKDESVNATAIWGRKRIQVIEMGYDLQEVQGVDLMFCGHSYIGEEPKIYGNTVFMDTGSGYYEDGIPNYPSIIKIEDML